MMKMVLRDEQTNRVIMQIQNSLHAQAPVLCRLRAGRKTDREIRHQALSVAYRKPRVCEQPEDPKKAPRHAARGFSYFN
jgi:hypothetical protein